MSILYRNWFVHNMLAHPLHELVYHALRLLMFGKIRARRVSDYIHDVTLPLDDTVVSVPHADTFTETEDIVGIVRDAEEVIAERQRQQCKEEAVLLCLKAGYALVRRGDDEHGFSIHCMDVHGDTTFLSKSASYESLWRDALVAAQLQWQQCEEEVETESGYW